MKRVFREPFGIEISFCFRGLKEALRWRAKVENQLDSQEGDSICVLCFAVRDKEHPHHIWLTSRHFRASSVEDVESEIELERESFGGRCEELGAVLHVVGREDD